MTLQYQMRSWISESRIRMLGFREPMLYHENGKVYGRVSSSGGTEVVEPVNNGERERRHEGFLVVCVVSTLSLLLATSSIVLNVVVTRESLFVAQQQQQQQLQRSLHVCLPCDEIMGSNAMKSDLESLERLFQSRKKKWNEGNGKRVEGLNNNNDDDDEDDEMCCADDAKQLEILLNKILDDKNSEFEKNEISQRSDNGSSYPPACDPSSLGSSNGTACLLPSSLSLNPNAAVAAAHLVSLSSSASVANSDARDVGGDVGLSIVKWNTNSRRSFHRGLNFNSTHLLPSLPGFYFVYSQVSFQFRRSSNTNNDDDSFTHLIKRFNIRNPNGGIELLMQHSSTIRGGGSPSTSSPSSSHPITDSSFLGGLVRVYPNDKLYVEASHHRSLRSLNTATFFGMFKIS